MRAWAALFLPLQLLACSEQGSYGVPTEAGGTLVISTTADPGTLFPPLIYMTQGKQISEQIYDYLADVGPGMNTRGDSDFRAQLADSWRWAPDSLSIAFHINPEARWHDGPRVTARDVQFTFALNKNPVLAGGALSDLQNIDSVTTQDSLTAVFWFRKRSPTQFLDAAAQALILPAHQLDTIPVARLRSSSLAAIGTGRFRLRRWDKGSSVEIVADSANYRGRAKLDRIVWSIAPDYTTALTRLFGGDADLFDAVRAEDMQQLERHRRLRAIIISGTDYNFLQFNLRDPANNALPHPLFADRSLRRALAMSIDRPALVKSVLDTLGRVALGPTVRAYPTTDTGIAQIPFDTARASHLLDSLGWRRTSTGMRARNDRPLAFKLLVPSSSRSRVRMAVLLQAELAAMGVRVTIEQMEAGAFVAREARHDFDAALGGWHMGASPDGTREAWTRAGIGKDGVNYGSYDNPAFDTRLDAALAADPAQAKALFTEAYEVINADAPAIWLYEPRTVIGVDRRFRVGWMRPDAWWSDLGDWYVPPPERATSDKSAPRR